MSFCPRKYCEGENIPKEVKPKTQATLKGQTSRDEYFFGNLVY
jgi:hypothetical protein